MKIAILSFYNGHVERGVENWACELASRLKNNHQITIYQAGESLFSSSCQKVALPINWSHPQTTSGPGRKLYLDYYSLKIAQFTREVLKNLPRDTDILLPVNGGWQSILCKLFCILKHKKLILVGHSGIGWDDHLNLLVKPDCFVVLTQYQKKWAAKLGTARKLTCIGNGVNVTEFTPHGKKKTINLPLPIILLPSALIPSKQIDKAIQAVSQLKKGSLAVLGRGADPYRQTLLGMGNRLLPGRFLLTHSPHGNMPLWYRAADIITFPSLAREAFGIVLLEALSTNKPVVANADPIREEIVGTGGILTDTQNINGYAASLQKALETDFGDKPRSQAEKFSWDIIADKYNELFTSL